MFLIGNGIYGDDPKTYNEAISDIDSEKWLEAIKSKIDSMHSNQVWTLVDPAKDIIPIGCKWIYKRKIGADENVETFKAKLVVKGYSQCISGYLFVSSYAKIHSHIVCYCSLF